MSKKAQYLQQIKEEIDSNEEVMSNGTINLKSFDLHDELNNLFWYDGNKLKPAIRIKLLSIARDFYDTLDIPELTDDENDTNESTFKDLVEDILFVGSLASYNYSSYADVDIHLLMNESKLVGKNKFALTLLQKYFAKCKSEWNLKHVNLNINSFDCELYVQDVSEKNAANGVFSLVKNEWVKEPEKMTSTFDKDWVTKKALNYISQIDDIEDMVKSKADLDALSKSLVRLDEIKTKIIKGRRDSLAASQDEMNSYNILFKTLRRTGHIGKINDLKTKIYDMIHSLNENFNKNNKKDYNLMRTYKRTIHESRETSLDYVESLYGEEGVDAIKEYTSKYGLDVDDVIGSNEAFDRFLMWADLNGYYIDKDFDSFNESNDDSVTFFKKMYGDNAAKMLELYLSTKRRDLTANDVLANDGAFERFANWAFDKHGVDVYANFSKNDVGTFHKRTAKIDIPDYKQPRRRSATRYEVMDQTPSRRVDDTYSEVSDDDVIAVNDDDEDAIDIIDKMDIEDIDDLGESVTVHEGSNESELISVLREISDLDKELSQNRFGSDYFDDVRDLKDYMDGLIDRLQRAVDNIPDEDSLVVVDDSKKEDKKVVDDKKEIVKEINNDDLGSKLDKIDVNDIKNLTPEQKAKLQAILSEQTDDKEEVKKTDESKDNCEDCKEKAEECKESTDESKDTCEDCKEKTEECNNQPEAKTEEKTNESEAESTDSKPQPTTESKYMPKLIIGKDDDDTVTVMLNFDPNAIDKNEDVMKAFSIDKWTKDPEYNYWYATIKMKVDDAEKIGNGFTDDFKVEVDK